MHRKRFYIALFAFVFLIACQSSTPVLTEMVATVVDQSTYPSPSLEPQEYPSPLGYQEPGETPVNGKLPVPPNDAPDPGMENGSVSGVLYNFTNQTILTNNAFFLAPAINDAKEPPPFTVGPDESRGDIKGLTDENGEFQMADIKPGTYYLIVWSPFDWPMAVVSPEDQSYRPIEIVVNQKSILGIVYIP